MTQKMRLRACIPLGTYLFTLWLSVLYMRSKAWLAARVSLRLAHLPRTASSAHVACAPRARLRQSFSRTLRSQNHNIFSMGPKLRYPTVPMRAIASRSLASYACNDQTHITQFTSPAHATTSADSSEHKKQNLCRTCEARASHFSEIALPRLTHVACMPRLRQRQSFSHALFLSQSPETSGFSIPCHTSAAYHNSSIGNIRMLRFCICRAQTAQRMYFQ
jgi:hypothetical protein